MYVYVAQDAAYWREDVSVALELDDDQVVGVAIQTCLEVSELHVEVDSQSFRLAVVHKRDSLEVVLYHWVEL